MKLKGNHINFIYLICSGGIELRALYKHDKCSTTEYHLSLIMYILFSLLFLSPLPSFTSSFFSFVFETESYFIAQAGGLVLWYICTPCENVIKPM